MPSLPPSSPIPEPVREAAERLAPSRVHAVEELRKGANNRIFRVRTEQGDFALKKYPAADARDRQGAEARALEFFARAGLRVTPLLVALDGANRLSLLSWVDGSPVESIGNEDVEQFAAFLIALDAAIDDQARTQIGEASEACLSGRRIVSQIATRLGRLEAVKTGVAGFAAFFDQVLRRRFEEFEQGARKRYAQLGLDFDADLPAPRQTLIPSDFGGHNALRGADGRLRFVDFEYFGWDDPLTSIGNFVLHPGMALSEAQQKQFTHRILARFGASQSTRLEALMPLFALRWCTIILGELLPERWLHRVEANPAVFADRDQAQHVQIDKAKRLLAQFSGPGAEVSA